jgi:hypothetical protein
MVNVVRMNKFFLDGGLADDMASDALMSSGATTMRGKPCRSGTDDSDGNLRNLPYRNGRALYDKTAGRIAPAAMSDPSR